MNFEVAFERLIGHEGGYVDHPSDPGGETNYGISKRSYPNEDIKNMTLQRAKLLYLRDYWQPAGCEQVPEGIRSDLFDMAVNSGVKKAIMTLQKAIGVTEDGVLGVKTQLALKEINPDRLVRRFNGARLLFMTGLSTWQTFSRGWARRIALNLLA